MILWVSSNTDQIYTTKPFRYDYERVLCIIFFASFVDPTVQVPR